jgi:hypothetical protein
MGPAGTALLASTDADMDIDDPETTARGKWDDDLLVPMAPPIPLASSRARFRIPGRGGDVSVSPACIVKDENFLEDVPVCFAGRG